MKAAALCIWMAGLVLAGPAVVRAADWKPSRHVEIVVGTSPGGGQDRSARFVQQLLEKERLLGVSSSVVNKPGGSTSIGYAYLNQHQGDGHYVMLLTVPLITNHILGISKISYSDLTPLAMLYEDYIVAAVTPGSPIKDAADLLARLKKDPKSLSVGISSLTAGGNFTIALAAKSAGIDPKTLKIVVFKSAGESMSALLGGHVDVVMATTAAPVAQRRQGKARLLAIAAPRRVGGELADVPTWRDHGTDVVFSNWRGMVGPGGLTAAQVGYWEDVFRRLVASDQFKTDVEKNQWTLNYLKSSEMVDYLKNQHGQLKALLTELGMAKQ